MYKILLVEDEDVIRRGLRFAFPWEQYQCFVVDEAANGVEGLEKIRQLQPDIVITDIGMPLKNGIEMLTQAHDIYPFCAIIISVYHEFELAKNAISLGVIDYLLKPLDHEQLGHALTKAAEKISQQRHLEKAYANNAKQFGTEVLNPTAFLPENISSKLVASMLSYIQEHYQQKITMAMLVEEFAVSETYLNRKFKAVTGYTVNEYINRFRIRRAIQIMREEGGKISMIATDVGFKDYKYFINVFKKYVGVSPSQFMEYSLTAP